jgi:hypothetical protein
VWSVRPANLAEAQLVEAADAQHIDVQGIQDAVDQGWCLPRRCAGVPQFVVEVVARPAGLDAGARVVFKDKTHRGASFLFEFFLKMPQHWLVQKVDALLGDGSDDHFDHPNNADDDDALLDGDSESTDDAGDDLLGDDDDSDSTDDAGDDLLSDDDAGDDLL